jgi:hypothetical protein
MDRKKKDLFYTHRILLLQLFTLLKNTTFAPRFEGKRTGTRPETYKNSQLRVVEIQKQRHHGRR